jgi:hypothetical protein
MDWGVLLAIGYAAIAALFGYAATFVVRRHEIIRDVALEIDEQLRGALDEAEAAGGASRENMSDVLDGIQRPLRNARIRSISLPARQRSRLDRQLGVADEVVTLLYVESDDIEARTMSQHYVQAFIAAVREETAFLLMPPPFVHRRRRGPESFPSREAFDAIMERHYPDRIAALNEALEPYRMSVFSIAD